MVNKEISPQNPEYKIQLVWSNIVLMVVIHLLGIYGICMIPFAQTETIWFVYVVAILSTLGVQAGAHRLWSHKAYKANFGLRLFLSLCHVMALQNDIYEWVRDHRAHHKFSDTDGDPHNASRGFFFSHVGWLLVRKHPEVVRRGKAIDLTDLERDPIVMFQRKYYKVMALVLWGLLPTAIPVYWFGESCVIAMSICVFFRYIYTLNLTWFVNSWSHIYGNRPYDQKIAPVESTIRHLLMGEGFHNYHHTFPWDYSASELGAADVFNPATAAIDLFHWMGWAWDLKRANPEFVQRRANLTGQKKYLYQTNRSLYEWTTGLLSVSAPAILIYYFHKCSF